MGWGKYLLLGDFGNRLDLDDADRRMKRMRARIAEQSGRDTEQDARLEAIEQELDEMKLLFTELVDTLIRKKALLGGEAVEMVRSADALMPDIEEDPEDQGLIEFVETYELKEEPD